jgi:protease PrsW
MPQKRVVTWVVAGVVLLIAALFGIISFALIGFETGPIGFFLGFVMATVPVPFYLAFSLWLDRFEPEPPWLLVLAFVWGAAIATFVALIFNTATDLVLIAAAGKAAAGWSAVVSAPFVEEGSKGLALFLLWWWQRDEFDDVTDGIVYATMVGLGFAMTENISYYGRAVSHGSLLAAGGTFFLRGIMGPFCHPLFTSMTGIGLGVARETRNKALKVIAPAVGLGFAMLLHFLWNLSASFGALFFVTYIIIMVPAFLAVLIVGLFSLRREAKIIRLHLEQLAPEGALSIDDLNSLSSMTGRLRGSIDAFRRGGLSMWKARGKFHAVTTDLAFHSWRQVRDERQESDWEQIRAEYIQQIVALRAQLQLPEPEPVEEIKRATSAGTLEVPMVGGTMAVGPVGYLLCTAGPLAGQRFDIGYGGIQIGRDPAAAQIVIRDPSVSKRHVWIGFRDSKLVAVDDGSTNGTYVNSTSSRLRAAELHSGDTLIIGNGVARFELQTQA